MSDESDTESNWSVTSVNTGAASFAAQSEDMEPDFDDSEGSQLKIGENGNAHRSYVDDKYVAYTIKLPAHQLAALQSIWLELKRLYGTHSPDKSGMIQQAVEEWLKRWDGSDRHELLDSLLQIRADTRRRQYRKTR